MSDLLTFAQSPLGAAVIVVLSLFAPKLYPFIAPFLNRFKNGATVQPEAPASAAAVPPTPPPDVLESALSVLKSLAQQRYSWMTPAQAVLNYASDEARRHAEETEQLLKKRVTETAAKAAS